MRTDFFRLDPLECRTLLSGLIASSNPHGFVLATLVPITVSTQVMSLTAVVPPPPLSYGQPVTVKVRLALPGSRAGLPLELDTDPGPPIAVSDSSGSAAFTLTPLPGDYTHTLTFMGNASSPSLQTTFSLTINPAPTALQLTVAGGQTLMVHLQLAKSFAPSLQSTIEGTLSLYDGNTLINSGSLSGTTQLSFPLSGSTPGLHHYRVDYSGSDLFAPASAALNFNYVPAAPTTVALVSSAPIQMTRTVTLTATVTPSASTGAIQGSVQFFVDGSLLGTGKVVGGKASVPFAAPANSTEQTMTFSALFQASSNYLDSASPQLALPVSQRDVIDVLAVMSQNTVNSQVGTSVIDRFNQEIDDANQAFANSDIPLQLRVVAIGGTSYSESGDLETDLGRLDTDGDGFLDEVAGLRNGYGADLVVLLDSAGSPSGNDVEEGIATELTNPKSAFRDQDAYIVIDINAPLDDYVLAHEVGHTLGAGHAIGDPDDFAAAPYGHGYRFTGDDGVVYHDIMAYAPGQLVAGFSNPSLTYAGVPFGNAKTADASRIISQDAPIVAAYRTAKPVGSIDTLTSTTMSGYALDPRIPGPMTVRVVIDNQAGPTFQADQPYSTIQHGYSYALPALAKGKHTVSLYGLDTFTGAWVLLVSRVLSV